MICASDDESDNGGATDMVVHHRKQKNRRRKGDIMIGPPESWMFGAGDSLSPPRRKDDALHAETEAVEDPFAIFSSITSIPRTITLALSVPVRSHLEPPRTEDRGRKRPSP